MKIFLAGKIARYDWRHDIVTGLDQVLQSGDFDNGWPIMPGAIYGKHDYTGPYFRKIEKLLPTQKVHRLCLESIRNSDLVFCWWNDETAFASLIELGYATALGIPYIIAYPPSYDNSEMWFASCCSQAFIRAPGPITGLKLGLMRYALLKSGASLPPQASGQNSPEERGLQEGGPGKCPDDVEGGDVGSSPGGSGPPGEGSVPPDPAESGARGAGPKAPKEEGS